MMSENSGIYKIQNKTDGKFYIGSAVCLKRRWIDHRKLLRKSKHFNRHLQFAWDKYGESNFEYLVVEECEKARLIQREQFHIDSNKHKIYNLNLVAGSQMGRVVTQETRDKISKANKGRVVTSEHKLALSKAWHGSEKTKLQHEQALKKAHEARRGCIESADTRLKKSLAKLGKKTKPMSEETKLKISNTKRKDCPNFDVATWFKGGMIPVNEALL
jgi:group I intron endonuclease